MSDSVPPAEGEPIGVVSSGWLRAARCSALICTIALGVGFVAEAAAHDLGAALITFGRWGRSVLHCSIFCSVGGRIHWHLRLVWARQRLSLSCSDSSLLGWRALVRCSATFYSYWESLVGFCHRSAPNPTHSGRCSFGSSVSLRQCSG